MCRHVGYLGAPVVLHDLLFGAPHSLCAQARDPRYQISGRANPDGWGVAWYPESDESGSRPASASPARYRTVTPIWADSEFAARSLGITSGAVIAAARLASPGAALVEAGNAPFVSGPWAFSLNGAVAGFREGIEAELRAQVTPGRLAEIRSDADSEVLFMLVLDRIDAGDAPGAALSAVIDRVTALTTGRLNLLLTDGHGIVAIRYGNSLFARQTTVASEPLDSRADWFEVPDHSLVVVTPEGHTNAPL
jgi:gamma-glutamyl hercynylcysteine S-oxide hydrolase